MKMTKAALLVTLLLFNTLVFSQAPAIVLKTGAVPSKANITQAVLDSFNAHAVRTDNTCFVVMQFSAIPNEEKRKILSASGIELMDYIPQNAYTATVTGMLTLPALQQAGAICLLQLEARQKMDVRLAAGYIPSSSVKIPGTIDLWISYPSFFQSSRVKEELKKFNADILPSFFENARILKVRISSGRIQDLASLPFIDYVQPAPGGDQTLNFNSRAASRANLLNAPVASGGRGLNGEGVVVGVGDNADVQDHIDFAGRLIDRAPVPTTMGHGHHTTGTVAGAGNGNELYRGFASKATIVSQAFSGILINASSYVQDYNMVITNNSYGDNIECGYFGTYDLISRALDQMAFDYPSLENVFSAGNSGTSSCSPFLPGYHTVLGGYQSAKNVITVGAATDSGQIGSFSSRGPVQDGRIKPEILAMGQFVASAWPTNIYSYNNGTSMSAPAVSGGLALLYQRYRQLNAGADPKNGLMKAVLCNGALDRGNAGPDYQYGFGWMNLLRSVDMLEYNHYFISTVTNNSTAAHSITVPANTAQLKVMLYWNDPPAAPISASSLVNDLDLEVGDPANVFHLPGILDTANANLGQAAITGPDHRNNMEQVVIDHPVSGNYSLKVKGTAVTQNPSQEYFLVYDIIPVQLKITSPVTGEAFAPSTGPNDRLKISWEAYGFTSGTALLEYSTDNGSTWITLDSNVDINRNIYTWWVPAVATSRALVRITKNGTGETVTSGPFTIVGQPAVSMASTQCEGYFSVNWTAVAGATDYEVMMLKGQDMQPIATTTGNSYTISGLSKDCTYWVTVRARVNGMPGRRPQAISRIPSSGNCAGSISDNDLKIDAIISPVSGRKFTSTELTAASPVTIRIKNLDDNPVNDFDLFYSINGGAFVSEHVTAAVAAGGSFTYTFTTKADLSAPGTYQLVAVVKNSVPDPVSLNDTAYVLVKQLDNQPLSLASYFVDNLESAVPSIYQRDTVGLTGVDRYDFSRTTAFGRLRTFVNTGMAYSGNRAFTLDVSRLLPAGNTSYLNGTFNLINYQANNHDVRLDFMFNQHGQQLNANNKVWVRGNDSQPWIVAYDLYGNQDDPGIFKRSSSIELSDLLAANGQDFGTSFQVRWGQWGQIAATDKENAAGYTFDNIRVYEVFNDLQMLSIDAPGAASCGLTNATPVVISVRNSDNNTISNIPVRYRVNNGSWISESIPSIAGNTSVQYNFSTRADFSAAGTYTITAVVDYGADSFHDNDTITSSVINSPVISTFPYLENFEAGKGFWYTDGKHNSWEYGTPASPKINRAASGSRAWKTRLAGNYNDLELSYLYSPCFNLGGMSNPTLSFSTAMDIEDCGTQLCDAAWVEYSPDGISWIRLGAVGTGTNWYNKPGDQLWSIQNDTRWHVATASLPANLTRLRLRFVFQSDPGANREGLAVDDIHIYNNDKGIYDGPSLTGPVSSIVSGNNWIDFTSSGKLVASIHPKGQNLGQTDVQAYINPAEVRFTNSQYYDNRNLTIKPAIRSLNDSVSVRFYFTDAETDSLISATGCTGCSKPSSAYELGVSKYSDPDLQFENGTINDNNQGIWTFISPGNVAIVPFDKGYYAEFRVKDFSEFWLNNGGFDRSSSLPVKLLDLIAQKINNDVLLKWSTASEADVDRYEIELARSLGSGFEKIGEVPSLGNTSGMRQYSFTDTEPDKFGTRYYRLKIVNTDGSFAYSPVRSVAFEDVVAWHVYPNPSKGFFSLVYQINNNTSFYARVLDAKGSRIMEFNRAGNGYLQKLNIDLTSRSAGVYLLEVITGGKKQVFKLYRE